MRAWQEVFSFQFSVGTGTTQAVAVRGQIGVRDSGGLEARLRLTFSIFFRRSNGEGDVTELGGIAAAS